MTPKSKGRLPDPPILVFKSNAGLVFTRYATEDLLRSIKEDPDRDHLLPLFVASICAGIEGTHQ